MINQQKKSIENDILHNKSIKNLSCGNLNANIVDLNLGDYNFKDIAKRNNIFKTNEPKKQSMTSSVNQVDYYSEVLNFEKKM